MRRSEIDFVIKLLEGHQNRYSKHLEKLRMERALAILRTERWRIEKASSNSRLYRIKIEDEKKHSEGKSKE